jgi:hypothetical protein
MNERIIRLSEFTKDEHGWWIKPDGTALHEDADDPRAIRLSLMCSALEWCGCGDPESALTYLRDVMRTLKPDSLDMPPRERDARYRERCAARNALMQGNPSADFTYYWLDNQGLTEHGSVVPGWLTEAGENLLADLEEALAK